MDRRFQISRRIGTTIRNARRGSRTGAARRRILSVAPTIVAVCVLAACGSNHTATSSQTANNYTPIPTPSYYNPPLQTGTASPAENDPLSTAVSSDSASGLTDIGSLTVAGTGVSISTEVSVGTPTPNTEAKPPDEVLSACNWDSTTVMAQAVYIHASLSIRYTGSIAQSVSIVEPQLTDLTNGALSGGAGVSGFAIQGPDGSWNDCGPDSSWAYVMQPGSTITADMWIDYPALSNAHPTFAMSEAAPLAIQFTVGGMPTSASGPHGANCGLNGDNPLPSLLLYSVPPYTYQAQDINYNKHPGTCTPA